MTASQDEVDPTRQFDVVSAKDSKSIFKPNVVTLVVSQTPEAGPNVMTAAWWMVGGYNPFRFVLTVSHHTYTHELIQEQSEFVLAAPTEEMLDAVTVAGSVSGRDLDKIDHLGLETVPGKDVDVPLLKQAVGNVECRVLESFEFEGCTYFVAGVENAYVQPGALDGRILTADADPLAYMGSDWANEDDDEKHRYYIDFDQDDIASYPGSEAIEALPPHLRD
jgi:flavin reductase (DIM6/NTAB) family NADH-FMN oxidoreductase RutF